MENEKVAVHTIPYITSQGFTCKKWVRFCVAQGTNPLGPRGGRCGALEDGFWVSGDFRRKADALRFAARLSEDNNLELI